MTFRNVYEDPERAAAYARLEFPGTYRLAYRDLPAILREHAHGPRAVDFGCGAGRSTRFVSALGFATTGLDISADMVALARERDSNGDYRVIADGDFSALPVNAFDLVTSIFTFDNVPGRDRKVALFAGLRGLLAPEGRLINLVSTPDIYVNDWASFSTKRFAGNFTAKAGDFVYTEMLDVPDRRPVQDVLWPRADYLDVYARAGLVVVAEHLPLGRADDGIAWVSEASVAPWAIYVLRAA